jgi:hypothetical protein
MGQYCARPKTVVKHTAVEKIQPAATNNYKKSKVARLSAETLRSQILSLHVGIKQKKEKRYLGYIKMQWITILDIDHLVEKKD